jgi:PAS domain S-box-containing protein
MIAPLPSNESARLDAVRTYEILDMAADPGLDDITSLAAEICETPIALISILDESRQWFLSKVGLPYEQTPREMAFCAHSLAGSEILHVPDALLDERFADNPLVNEEPRIRFYAGIPLVAAGGSILGTLCVMDHVPRVLTEHQQFALRVLSQQVMSRIQSRRDCQELKGNIVGRMQAEEKLARLNRLYLVLGGTHEMIMRETQLQQLVDGVCRIAVDEGLFRSASIFGCAAGAAISHLIAQAGIEDDCFSERPVAGSAGELSHRMIATVLRTGAHDVRNDLLNDAGMAPWRESAMRCGYRSVAAFPIKHDSRTFGVLILFAAEAWYFQEDEIGLMVSVAEDVSFAIETLDKEQRRLEAEAALRASEATMAAAQRMGHFGSWELELVDPDDPASDVNIVRLSDEMYRIMGLEPGDAGISRELMCQIVHPDDRDRVGRAFGDAIRERRLYSVIVRIIRPDGEERILDVTGQIFCDEKSGRPLKVIGNTHDITDQRRAEETVRESEQRFRDLAENITEVFWVSDPFDHEILYVSPSYETVWGRSCASLYQSPRSWRDFIHPDDRIRVVHSPSDGELGSHDETYRIVRPDGEVRWIHDRGYPVRNDKGEVYRMVGIAEDITERRQVEEKLREQATLLEKARDAIVVRDLEHRVIYWNLSAERLYGWSSEEAVGESAEKLLYLDSANYSAATRQTLDTGEWIGEIEQHTRDGRTLTVEGHWTLVLDERGEPKSILSINTDITARKSLEQQFLRAQRIDSIGTLAGGIAHDLNNVLAPIMMSIDLLKKTITAPRELEILSMIGASARRGADMVNQVLSFASGMEGHRTKVQIDQLIHDMVKIAGDTFPKNIQVEAALDPDLWPLEADPTQLHQVLLNLCINARDAMPGGGRITIRASNTMIDSHYAAMTLGAHVGQHVRVDVEDNGTGMTKGLVDSIFDPFFTTKEVGKGTGLGLSTALAIVKGHGGFIQVRSEVGSGSCFSIYLPADKEAVSESSEEHELILPRGNGETILVVDDEASIRQITRQTLEAFGYNTLVACNGAEAVSIYAEHRDTIKVVLTDMMMPIMDGPSLIKVLKRLNPDVPIIGASGIATKSLATDALLAGMLKLIPKPYSAEVLLNVLKEVMAKKNE